LIWKHFQWLLVANIFWVLNIKWFTRINFNFYCVKIIQLFTRKSTNNYYFIIAKLAHSRSLSRGDLTWNDLILTLRDIYLLPFISINIVNIEIQSFYWVWILLIIILNTSKNIDELIIETTTCMVMSALINHRHFNPIIIFCIVNLHSIWSLIKIFSWSRNNYVPVKNWAAWVSMSSVFHPCFFY
jgi:hypothetical protein